MQFPESWLREFCDPPINTAELAELLTLSGMEVEELRPVAPPFKGVVVAEVVSVEPHPNADKLRVCTVNAGAESLLQIVCGAPNVRAGMKVPCAMVGAELPAPIDKPEVGVFRIRLGKLRGIDSHGMLCSASELHLPDAVDGLLALADDAPVGQDIRHYLGLDDTLFTLKLTPNLGHALSVWGVAREVAALTGAPLTPLASAPGLVSLNDTLPVTVEAPDLCGRFSGRILRGVNPRAATPRWMVDRLARCGQRSVSALVDISNYVMFESGQPSHVFDLDKIHGGLTVRWAREGESLKLLNGQTVALDTQVGVIANAQAVESLAGIMGGDATSVSDDTRHIYLEAAFWWPQSVAGRSRRYNFSTDAGHRYERGVDPAQTLARVERVTQLIQSICGGEAGPVTDLAVNLPQRQPVTLRVARAAKVIGMAVSQEACAGVMQRLGFDFTQTEGCLQVRPPSWRFDLQIEEDLIEEVIRVLGYAQLPDDPPLAPVVARVRSESVRSAFAVRHCLAALDYLETINFSFVEAQWEADLAGNTQPVRLLNPIAAPLSVMRSSLMGGLVAVLRHNLSRKVGRVRTFEVGRVFLRDAEAAAGPLAVAGVRQPMRVGGLAYGPAAPVQWGSKERSVDFFDVKGDLERLFAPRSLTFMAAPHPALHPGRSAEVHLDGRSIGFVGELHPRWRQSFELPLAPILFELSLEALMARELPVYTGLPRHQAVWRDLAVLMPNEVTHAQLMRAVQTAHPLVRSASLFDVYKPVSEGNAVANERSLAVRIELNDEADAALTEDRIETAMAAIVSQLSQHGGRLRG